jgi:peptide/nickel transport system permease protein
MSRFLLRRFILMCFTLVCLSVVLFAVVQVLPGNPGRAILGQFATPEQVERVNHQLGADRPVPTRYWNWARGFVKGEWGKSYTLNVPVRGLVLQRLENSLLLGLFALTLIVPISIGCGVLAALHYRKFLDRLISVVGLSVVALPEFVGGAIVLVIFAATLEWLPASSTVPSSSPIDWVRQLLLPSIPLMLALFAYISRMARAGTITSLRSNYVRTARLKGLPRRTVIRRHVLRNSLLPTISVVAVQAGHLVGALVVIETLFNYPGIGKLLYDAALNHDIPVLSAGVVMVAIVYMSLNALADILYALLDPRIRAAT